MAETATLVLIYLAVFVPGLAVLCAGLGTLAATPLGKEPAVVVTTRRDERA